MKRVIAAAALVAATLVPAFAATPPGDGTDLAALRTAMRTDKKAYVAAELQLTPAEAKAFWPVYDAYQRQLEVIGTRTAVMIEEIVTQSKSASDRYAKLLMQEVGEIEDEQAKAVRQVRKGAQKALPPIKAARYLQIEQKARAVQAYDLASVMPLLR